MRAYDPARRVPHVIRPNERESWPRRIVAVDTEAVITPAAAAAGVQLHHLRLGCARLATWGRRGWVLHPHFHFRGQAEWWAWLRQHTARRATTWVVAHNCGYDLTLLDAWDMLLGDDVTMRSVCLGDPPTIIRCSFSGRRVVVCDTLNWLPGSLALWGELCGMPKGDWPGPGADEATLTAYCQRDVDVLMTVMLRLVDWWRESDSGWWAPTAAGLGWSRWRHRHYTHPVRVHADSLATGLERCAYYGGRVQAYRIGDIPGPVYHLDVASQYPAVMATALLPCRLRCTGMGGDASVIADAMADGSAVAQVEVETERDAYPMRTRRRTVWPVGRYWTVLCGPELARAYHAGHVRRVGTWAVYELAPVLADFAQSLWAERCRAEDEGRPDIARAVKYMMDAMSGKFGQRSSEWMDDPELEVCEPWSTWLVVSRDGSGVRHCRAIGMRGQVRGAAAEWHDAMPAISAWIAAHGREQMRRLMAICPQGSCYYVGVDALLVSQSGLDALTAAGEVQPRALGRLRLVHSHDAATIWGRRCWQLGDARHVAGVPRRARQTGHGAWRGDAFGGLASVFRQSRRDHIVVTERTWTVTARAEDGWVTGDGWLRPWCLPRDWDRLDQPTEVPPGTVCRRSRPPWPADWRAPDSTSRPCK